MRAPRFELGVSGFFGLDFSSGKAWIDFAERGFHIWVTDSDTRTLGTVF